MKKLAIIIALLVLTSMELFSQDSVIIKHHTKYTSFIPSWWTESNGVPESFEEYVAKFKLEKEFLINRINESLQLETYYYDSSSIYEKYTDDERSVVIILNDLLYTEKQYSKENLTDLVISSYSIDIEKNKSWKLVLILTFSGHNDLIYIGDSELNYISNIGYYCGELKS